MNYIEVSDEILRIAALHFTLKAANLGNYTPSDITQNAKILENYLRTGEPYVRSK